MHLLCWLIRPAVVRQPSPLTCGSRKQIAATWYAFAAILDDGSVCTWGSANHGGDSSSVQGKLRQVKQIAATEYAFAAILDDGSVCTRGNADHGGDSSSMQGKLRQVKQIAATQAAFAAPYTLGARG